MVDMHLDVAGEARLHRALRRCWHPVCRIEDLWNARTYRLGPEHDAELAAFQALILDQDKPVVESQRPEELPVDLSTELHIAGPDKASIAYRRRLAELASLRA